VPDETAISPPLSQTDEGAARRSQRGHYRRPDLVVVHGGLAPRAEPVPAPRPPRVAVTGVRT
jgi:hypothetical protein